MVAIKVKRVYAPPAAEDGTRVLVDRLWPRGLTKERAGCDLWLKDVAPSHELRKRSSHDAEGWERFRKDYRKELRANSEPVDQLRKLLRKGTVTLLFAQRDEVRNNAVVLKEYLEEVRKGREDG